MSFVNTIDEYGDQETFIALTERTIEEFKDDQITEVGQYAFRSCNQLTTVYLPSVTKVSHYAFRGCENLTDVDLPLATDVRTYAFSDCISLEQFPVPSVSNYIAAYSFNNCI